MNRSQQARLDALHRIQSFLDENATTLGNVNKSSARAALNDVLTELEARAAAQGASEVQATSSTLLKRELRDDLRLHHMQPVAAIARATLAHTPFIAKLRLPKKNVNDSSLVAAGNTMADVAGQYSDVFVAEQLPADFAAQLRSSVDAVRNAAVVRDKFEVALRQSTQAVDDELIRAHNVVKVLDSLVVRQLKGRNDLLAGWRKAKHPKAKPGVPQGSGAVPLTVAAPEVTTA